MLRIYKRFFLIKIFQPARVSENICPNRDCSPAAHGVNVWNLMGGIERLSWRDKKLWEFLGNFLSGRPAVRLYLCQDFLCFKKISISLNQNINPAAAWEFRLLNRSCICWLGFVGRFESCFPALYSNLFSRQNYWKYLSLQILLPLVKFTFLSLKKLALLFW